MNPISGTYRYPAAGPDTDSLLTFLADSKERNELSMVVDEELKMLCAVADRDVRLHGPYLREMSHLAHTEFEIRGRGVKEVREVLSRTMFAATVTGSPLKSACRVIRAHEPSGRGYYAGALALFGQDASGQRWLDSPITIRTADVTPDGALRIPVGATLVRDSDPRSEVAETHAKLAGVLSAFGVTPARDAAARPAPPGPRCALPRSSRPSAAVGGTWRPADSTPTCTGRSTTGPTTVASTSRRCWSWTPRTTSPRCWRTCCGWRAWAPPWSRTTTPACARHCGTTGARSCSGRGPATRTTPPTRASAHCGN